MIIENQIQSHPLKTLASALLNLILAVIIFRSYRHKQKSNVELAQKNIEIEEKQKEILDSIRYASRIQRALITSEKNIAIQLNRLMKKNQAGS